MNLDSIIFELSAIIVGAAFLGTLFLYAKQPIIIAYIVIGFAMGPNGFALIEQTEHIEKISHLGVILLLFLVGLNLQPTKLIKLFKSSLPVTLGTALIFGVASFLFAMTLTFSLHSAVIFGAAMMFSSTVVGLKLIPTTTLHHKHTGEVMTSVLLIQDIMAILVILFITGEKSDHVAITFTLLAAKFLALCLAAFLGVRFIVVPLLKKFDVVQEYTFIMTLGWCLFWAETAHILGLSYEMGAFVAGLSIASCRAALVISEHLKPLREFFLILFFFTVGANLNLQLNPVILVSAALFGMILVPLKMFVYRFAFLKNGESKELSKELGVRLAQASEFSLLVVFAALSTGVMNEVEGMVIQIATIVTFVISTYWTVLKYPTPISGSKSLRQD